MLHTNTHHIIMNKECVLASAPAQFKKGKTPRRQQCFNGLIQSPKPFAENSIEAFHGLGSNLIFHTLLSRDNDVGLL